MATLPPPSAPLVLALDSGSQSSRALIFDPQGQVLAVGQRTHLPMLHPTPGAVEQDQADIQACLEGAAADAVKAWGGDASRIVAGAMTTQRNTAVLLDADGAALQPAISWLDRRSAPVDSEPRGWLRLALRAMGDDAVLTRLLGKSIPRQLHARAPELLRQVRHIAPLEAWLHQQWTGNLALAPGGVAGVWPFDPGRRDWHARALMLDLLSFERRWLPTVVEAGQLIGRVLPAVAARTGLPAGLPLYACGGDKQAECLGAGVRHDAPGLAAVSLGTGSSVSLVIDRALESPRYRWITTCAAEPGAWCMENMVFRGMWTAAWFARELGGDLRERAQAEGRPVEALLCDEAAKVAAGSEGLLTWPRWSPSIGDPSETGALLGIREIHGRGHLFRSLLEGIALDLRAGLETIERASGRRVEELRVGGGGARSDLVVHILAAVLDRPVRRPPSAELSARGAALVAAVAGGLHPDMRAAVAAMVPDAPLQQPDPDDRRTYARVYEAAYRRVGPTLRPLNRALQAT